VTRCPGAVGLSRSPLQKTQGMGETSFAGCVSFSFIPSIILACFLAMQWCPEEGRKRKF